ncbi:MAG: hypothetical protein ABIQ11_11405, partial [Saprospiraceae bacterium]
GRFELYLPEKNAILETYFVGYEDNITPAIQGQEDLVIIMKEGLSIPPALAYGIANQSIQIKDTGLIEQNNIRKESLNIFLKYLNSNSRFPIAYDFSPSAKEVKVEFRVISKGQPERVNVVRSSGEKKYEDEAIRLLKEGPKNWVCDEGIYPCMKEFTFYFE